MATVEAAFKAINKGIINNGGVMVRVVDSNLSAKAARAPRASDYPVADIRTGKRWLFFVSPFDERIHSIETTRARRVNGGWELRGPEQKGVASIRLQFRPLQEDKHRKLLNEWRASSGYSVAVDELELALRAMDGVAVRHAGRKLKSRSFGFCYYYERIADKFQFRGVFIYSNRDDIKYVSEAGGDAEDFSGKLIEARKAGLTDKEMIEYYTEQFSNGMTRIVTMPEKIKATGIDHAAERAIKQEPLRRRIRR